MKSDEEESQNNYDLCPLIKKKRMSADLDQCHFNEKVVAFERMYSQAHDIDDLNLQTRGDESANEPVYPDPPILTREVDETSSPSNPSNVASVDSNSSSPREQNIQTVKVRGKPLCFCRITTDPRARAGRPRIWTAEEAAERCRVCGQEKENLINAFTRTRPPLVTVLRTELNIRVTTEDHAAVCLDCTTKLAEWFAFKKNSETAQRKWNSYEKRAKKLQQKSPEGTRTPVDTELGADDLIIDEGCWVKDEMEVVDEENISEATSEVVGIEQAILTENPDDDSAPASVDTCDVTVPNTTNENFTIILPPNKVEDLTEDDPLAMETKDEKGDVSEGENIRMKETCTVPNCTQCPNVVNTTVNSMITNPGNVVNNFSSLDARVRTPYISSGAANFIPPHIPSQYNLNPTPPITPYLPHMVQNQYHAPNYAPVTNGMLFSNPLFQPQYPTYPPQMMFPPPTTPLNVNGPTFWSSLPVFRKKSEVDVPTYLPPGAYQNYNPFYYNVLSTKQESSVTTKVDTAPNQINKIKVSRKQVYALEEAATNFN